MSESDTAVTTQMRDETAQVGKMVQAKAGQAKDEGTQKLREQLDERTTQAGRQAGTFVRKSATHVGLGARSGR